MEVWVYVIESVTDQVWYTGMAIDPVRRLADHNACRNRFTKGHLPWKLIFTERHENWKGGRVREKYLKSASGKNWLRKFLLSGGDTGSLPA